MSCSNKDCPNHGNDQPPINRLGECKACHNKRMLALRGDLVQLPTLLVKWFGEAEKAYGQNCFYSADIETLMSNKDQEKLAALGLADIGFKAQLMVANNGKADSFMTKSKNFTIMNGIEPSTAIRSFIRGRLTVCECEGMIKAVIFNALCEFVGDPVFDIAFAGLVICGSGWEFERTFIDEQKKPIGEGDCDVGDWTFYAHTTNSAVKFRHTAEKTKKGGSASGWNLICASGGGVGKNTYFGFGLSGGRSEPRTLHQVKVAMIKECGGDPDDREWDLYLHFRRQVNGGNFLTWLETRLKIL